MCIFFTVGHQVSSSTVPPESLCGWAVMTPSPKADGSGWMDLRSDTSAGLQVFAQQDFCEHVLKNLRDALGMILFSCRQPR